GGDDRRDRHRRLRRRRRCGLSLAHGGQNVEHGSQPTGAGGTRRRALLHVQVLLDQSGDLGDGVGVVAGHGDLRALVGTERHDEHGGGGVGGVLVGDRDLDVVVVLLGGLGDDAGGAGVQTLGGADG